MRPCPHAMGPVNAAHPTGCNQAVRRRRAPCGRPQSGPTRFQSIKEPSGPDVEIDVTGDRGEHGGGRQGHRVASRAGRPSPEMPLRPVRPRRAVTTRREQVGRPGHVREFGVGVDGDAGRATAGRRRQCRTGGTRRSPGETGETGERGPVTGGSQHARDLDALAAARECTRRTRWLVCGTMTSTSYVTASAAFRLTVRLT